jgi:DNA-binding MarR family transcriptional regulator
MNSTIIDNDAVSQFALNIFRINGLLLRNGDRLTKDIGQSSARWQVLGRTDHQPQTVAQIAKSMGHARQSVQRIADVLVRDGLVIYKSHPADRRTQLLELTPAGKKILADIYARNMIWTKHIMKKFSDQQLSTVNEKLEYIADILEEDEQSKEVAYD